MKFILCFVLKFCTGGKNRAVFSGSRGQAAERRSLPAKILKGLTASATLAFFVLANHAYAAQALTLTPQKDTAPKSAQPPLLVPPPPKLNAKGYVLMDAHSGQILAANNMNEHMPPASLTKLMTLYIAERALAEGEIKLKDKVRISKKAWKTGGSRMFVQVGSRVPVKDLIQGIIVDSGNDATVALAEYIGGSENAFVSLMNAQAQALGMKNTHYTDANGLPHPDHYSTPRDLAVLARHVIQNYPQYYHWFKQRYFTWDGIKQSNRNWLLWRDPAVDGLKTGHTKAAGYCLISSAKRKNMRLITVVMGTPTEEARIEDSEALLNYGFRFYRTYELYKAHSPILDARVWLGEKGKIPVGLSKPLFVSVPKGEYNLIKISANLNEHLSAPLQKGEKLGTISVKLKNKTLVSRPLIALTSDAKGGLWTRFTDYISLSLRKLFSRDKKVAAAPKQHS